VFFHSIPSEFNALGGFTKILALLNREEKELADQVIAAINHFLMEVAIETAELKEENTINAKLEETKRKPFKGVLHTSEGSIF
jgi:hypothetical protein